MKAATNFLLINIQGTASQLEVLVGDLEDSVFFVNHQARNVLSGKISSSVLMVMTLIFSLPFHGSSLDVNFPAGYEPDLIPPFQFRKLDEVERSCFTQ